MNCAAQRLWQTRRAEQLGIVGIEVHGLWFSDLDWFRGYIGLRVKGLGFVVQ